MHRMTVRRVLGAVSVLVYLTQLAIALHYNRVLERREVLGMEYTLRNAPWDVMWIPAIGYAVLLLPTSGFVVVVKDVRSGDTITHQFDTMARVYYDYPFLRPGG